MDISSVQNNFDQICGIRNETQLGLLVVSFFLITSVRLIFKRLVQNYMLLFIVEVKKCGNHFAAVYYCFNSPGSSVGPRTIVYPII